MKVYPQSFLTVCISFSFGGDFLWMVQVDSTLFSPQVSSAVVLLLSSHYFASIDHNITLKL